AGRAGGPRPRRPPQLGRHLHGAGQVEEVRRAGQERPAALDPEVDMVALAQPERLTDRPGIVTCPFEVTRAATSIAVSLLQ
ncbi:MAG TPA: hypothetical protein VG411_07000, partial [Actinomycetota bacterium]|nr:hypothetical protein [Actinomycetota bacterium]